MQLIHSSLSPALPRRGGKASTSCAVRSLHTNAHVHVFAPHSSAPARLAPSWAQQLPVKCVCSQAELLFGAAARKARRATRPAPSRHGGSRFTISRVSPPPGWKIAERGVISSLLAAGAGALVPAWEAGNREQLEGKVSKYTAGRKSKRSRISRMRRGC